MRESVWSPNGMKNTSIEEFDKTYPNKAQLYKKNLLGFAKDTKTNLSIKYPAGGVHSTSADMLRFADAFMMNKLIKEESKMESFQVPALDPKPHLSYGLGWILEKDEDWGEIMYHDGHQSGTSTELIIVPSKNIAVIVLANSSNSNSQVHRLARGLLDLHK